MLDSNGLTSPQLSISSFRALQKELWNHKEAGYQVLHDREGNEQLVVFRPFSPPGAMSGSGGAILQMGKSTAALKKQLFQQLTTFIVLSVLAFAGGLALFLPLLKKSLYPLSKIVGAVEKINAGNLAHRVPESQGQEEIDQLAETFNGMLERLEASFLHEKETKEQMRRFIADASHELWTPLTSIHGFLEVALKGIGKLS
ncbi:HAMP domain-containing protein [Actinomycetes bacterium NPDC127524]